MERLDKPIIFSMPGLITNLYDSFEDAWRYESDYSDYADDVPLVLEISKAAGGPVLEAGAGTGRLTLPMARAGVKITAIEKSKGMCELFEKKLANEDVAVRANVKLVSGELSSAALDGRFSSVLLPFNFLQLMLTRQSRLEFLKLCRHSLVNRGKLYVEIGLPHPDYMGEKRVTHKFVKSFFDRYKRQWVSLFQSHEYNPVDQTLMMEYNYLYMRGDGATECVTRFVMLAVIFPKELDGLIEESGLKIENVWGGFDKSAVSKSSRRIILLAGKP